MKDFYLKKDAKITFEEIEISLTYVGAKKIIGELNVDEIFDAINESIGFRSITKEEVFLRICDDYKDELTGLLQKFWGRKSDACPLECTEHEKQLGKWKEWIKTL